MTGPDDSHHDGVETRWLDGNDFAGSFPVPE